MFYVDEQGKESIVRFAQKNWWISDYLAFFKQKNASTCIECIEPGEVVYATLQAREQVSADLQKMEHFYRENLTNGYVALQQCVKLLHPKRRNSDMKNFQNYIFSYYNGYLKNKSQNS